MSDKIKLVDFKNKKPDPTSADYEAQLPSESDIKKLLMDGKLRGVIAIFYTNEGVLSHYVDGLSMYQAAGMMEEVKFGLLGFADVADIDLEDE